MTTLMGSNSETTVTPMLTARNASEAITWYTRAFGAQEVLRLDDAGKVSHCEFRIGSATIMLSDEFPEIDVLSPETIGGSPVMLLLEVRDVDAVFARAVSEGATIVRPVAGDTLRNGKLVDPYGHRWMILTRNASGPDLA